MFSHVRGGVMSMLVLAVLATSTINCDCNGEIDCYEGSDCFDQVWSSSQCTAEEGHWECHSNLCAAVCDEPVCEVASDCDGGAWPSIDEIDCYVEEGHWECSAGECVPVCNLECDLDLDCQAFSWDLDCNGNWDCIQGLCEEACDPVGCGDADCDADGGETADSCPDDCVEPCSVPSDCVDSGEWAEACFGRWGCELGTCTPMCDYITCGDGDCNPTLGEDAASCTPDCLGTCQLPTDCIHDEWTKICQGRYTCFMGNCQQTCDDGINGGCGNDTCDGAQGETAESCFRDCLGGPCKAATDCLGFRWYENACPDGGYWECAQPAGACEAICDDVACGDGTCDVLGGEAATGCPADCGDYDCDLSEDCDGLGLPVGCDVWLCVNRNCNPVCP